MHRRLQLVLNGSAIESESELHRELAELLGFFDGYGHNLDALWAVLEDDALRGVKGPVEVVWQDAAGFARSQPDYFLRVQRLFAETRQPISLLISF